MITLRLETRHRWSKVQTEHQFIRSANTLIEELSGHNPEAKTFEECLELLLPIEEIEVEFPEKLSDIDYWITEQPNKTFTDYKRMVDLYTRYKELSVNHVNQETYDLIQEINTKGLFLSLKNLRSRSIVTLHKAKAKKIKDKVALVVEGSILLMSKTQAGAAYGISYNTNYTLETTPEHLRENYNRIDKETFNEIRSKLMNTINTMSNIT